MPSLDGKTVELRVATSEDGQRGPDFTVSVEDMLWVQPPPKPPAESIDTPEKEALIEAVMPILEDYGLALIACRVEERQAGYLIVAVPALSGPSRISVYPGALARPFRRRPNLRWPNKDL